MQRFQMRNISRIFFGILLALSAAVILPAQSDPAVEKRIVDYLKQHVEPGKPVVVSELVNKVFTTEEERKELSRLFNIFFKIPVFIVQHKAATDQIPTLADISRQFNLRVAGEANVLLTIMESDPRIPKFLTRDPASGEILSVNIEAVKKDSRFSQAIEHTLAGWSGRTAPDFSLDLFDGGKISSGDLSGENYLIYFWFSGCPPCMKLSPSLSRLLKKYADDNFRILAVNADRILELDTTDKERADYIRRQALGFTFAHLNKEMQEKYGNVSIYPTLFLIDSRSVIRKHYIGYQEPEVLTSDIEQILGME
jgi:thiol-disulfide isomerase/thioredoxin